MTPTEILPPRMSSKVEVGGTGCSCGHARFRHNHGGTSACTATAQSVDMSGLPKPEYAPGTEDHPKAWPLNWPSAGVLPVTDVLCGCPVFTDSEGER